MEFPESIFTPQELTTALQVPFDDVQKLLPGSPASTSTAAKKKSFSRSSSDTSGAESFYNQLEEASEVLNASCDEFSTQSFHEDMSLASCSTNGLVYRVQFKSTTDDFYLGDNCTRDIAVGDYVRVEADRGHDVGTVADIFWPSPEEVQALAATNNKQILSIASENEYMLCKGKARDEARALSICREVASSRNMRINLVDAEYQYDRKKLTFFFTSDGHTDFRELVRDLFAIFKTRIWMQKIKPFEALAFQKSNSPIPRFNGGGSSTSGRQQAQCNMLANGSEYGSNFCGSDTTGSVATGDIYRSQVNQMKNTSRPKDLLKQATHQSSQMHSLPLSRNYPSQSVKKEHFQYSQQWQPQPQLDFHQIQNPFTACAVSDNANQQYTSLSSYAARFSTQQISGQPATYSPSPVSSLNARNDGYRSGAPIAGQQFESGHMNTYFVPNSSAAQFNRAPLDLNFH